MSSSHGKECHQGATKGACKELGEGVGKEILAEEVAFELRSRSSKEVAKQKRQVQECFRLREEQVQRP